MKTKYAYEVNQMKQPFAANSSEFFWQIANRLSGDCSTPVYVYKIKGWREIQVGTYLDIRRDQAEQRRFSISDKPGKIQWMAKIESVYAYMMDQGNF